jgi:hypothetical protein
LYAGHRVCYFVEAQYFRYGTVLVRRLMENRSFWAIAEIRADDALTISIRCGIWLKCQVDTSKHCFGAQATSCSASPACTVLHSRKLVKDEAHKTGRLLSSIRSTALVLSEGVLFSLCPQLVSYESFSLTRGSFKRYFERTQMSFC